MFSRFTLFFAVPVVIFFIVFVSVSMFFYMGILFPFSGWRFSITVLSFLDRTSTCTSTSTSTGIRPEKSKTFEVTHDYTNSLAYKF